MAKSKQDEGGAAVLDAPAKQRANILDADKAAQIERTRPLHTFTVAIDGDVHTVQAQTWGDAWALVCDKRKKWPSIKYSGARVLNAEGVTVYPVN